MATPSVRGIGAKANSGNALTVTPYASHVSGDYELLVVETANQAATLSTAAGFSAVTGGVASIGTAAGADGTRMTLFERFWNGSDGSPVIADSGDHQFAYIISFQNVARVGSPGTNTQAATTAGSITGLSGLSPSCLVVHCSAGSLPDQVTGAEISAGPTNGNLGNLTKDIDETTNSGNGGWIGVITGTLDAGGTSGTTTFTKSTSCTMAHVVLPLYGVTTVESSFSANAIIRKPNVSPTGFTADAVIKANSGTKSFSADAVILRNSGTKSFSADAITFATYGVTYQRSTPDTSGDNWGTSSSAKIAQSFTIINSGRSSARLRVIRFWLKTINAPTDDVILSLSRWSGGPDTPETEIVIPTVATIPASSLNPTTWTEVTATLDYPLDDTHAYYILLGRSVVDDVNYYSLRTSLNDYDSGNLLFKVGGGWIAAPDNDAAFWVEADWASISADASIHKHTTASFSADAFVLGWFTADAWIRPASFPIYADAIIKRNSGDLTFSADASIHKHTEHSFTAEAAIHKSHPPFSFSSDAILWREWDKTFASDAIIEKTQNPTGLSADAIRRKTQNFVAESLTETPNNVTPATFAWGWSPGPGNTTYIGQAFQPRLNGTISSVDLWLGTNSGGPTDTVTITLEADDGNGKPSGTVLATIASFNGSTIPGAPQQRTYPFSPVAVSKDTTYHFVIKRSSPSDIHTYSAVDYGIAGDQYSRGWATYYDTSWKIWTGYDLRFSTTVAYIPIAADATLKKTIAPTGLSADAIIKRSQTTEDVQGSVLWTGWPGYSAAVIGHPSWPMEAQSFRPQVSGRLVLFRYAVKAYDWPGPAQVDDLIVEVWSDTAGHPGSSIYTVETIPHDTITANPTGHRWVTGLCDVTAGTKYWLVFRRSGAVNANSYYEVVTSGSAWGGGEMMTGNATGTSWSPSTPDGIDMSFEVHASSGVLADAVLRKTIAQSFTADACIKATKLSGSFTTGTAGVQGGFGADDSHRLGQQFYLPVAALLTGITLPLKQYGDPTDDLIAEIQTNTHVTDPLVFDMPSGTVIARSAPFSMLSLTGSYQDITFSLGAGCDANTPYWFILYRTGAYDGNHFPAARLNQQSGWNGWWCETGNTWRTDLAFYLTGNYASAFTTNATFKKTVAGSFSADAFVAGWFTADAWIEAAITGGSFSANAIFLRNSGTKTFTADACIVRTQTGFSFSTDAILHKTMPGSASADAVIHATLEKTFTADAIRLANSGAKTFSVDAVIGANSGTKSFSSDAVIKTNSGTKSISADAAFRRNSGTLSFSADAIIKRTVSTLTTVNFDAPDAGSLNTGNPGGWIEHFSTISWADALAGPGDSPSYNWSLIGGYSNGSSWRVRQTFYPYDTSSLAGKTVVAARFAVRSSYDDIPQVPKPGFSIFRYDWSDADFNSGAAFRSQSQLTGMTASASVAASSIPTGAGGITVTVPAGDINTAGKTKWLFVSSDNVDGHAPTGVEDRFIWNRSPFNSSLPPRLSVDYGNGPTADAVIKANSGTKTFTADAVITGTRASSFTADAVITSTQPGNFSADAVLFRTEAFTFAADAVKHATFEGSFTADAVLWKALEGSLTGDAILLRLQEGSFASDASVLRIGTGSFSADAFVLGWFTADAWIAGLSTGFFNADAVIHRNSGTKTFTADAVVKATTEGSFTTDATFLATTEGSLSADAVIVATVGGTLAADAVLRATIPGSLNADADIWATVEKTFTADAWFAGTAAGAFSADATFRRTFEEAFSADAVTLKTFEFSLSADAVLAGTATGSLSADAVVRWTVEGTLSADAVLLGRTQGGVNADAIITANSGTKTFTADAWILATGVESITADAVIHATLAKTFTADAWIGGTGVGAFTGDAVIRRSQAGNFSADAVIHRVPSATITADAVLKWTAQHAFSADAAQLKRSEAAFTADAMVKATRTDGFSASATLFGTVVSTFTADAVFVVHRESTFSVDATFRRTGAGALAGDAVIWGTRSGSVTADAVLTSERSGFSFTADAEISLTARTQGSFTADAYISNHATMEIEADAFARTFEADASAVTIDWTAGDMSLTFVQGNTEPPIQSVIHEEDVPANIVDLSTATEVRFQMRKYEDHRYTVNGLASVIDPLAGLVQYEWAANDLSVPGTYLAQWEIHYSGGGIQTTSPEVEITVRRR